MMIKYSSNGFGIRSIFAIYGLQCEYEPVLTLLS